MSPLKQAVCQRPHRAVYSEVIQVGKVGRGRADWGGMGEKRYGRGRDGEGVRGSGGVISVQGKVIQVEEAG